jgi:hypothetical protein
MPLDRCVDPSRDWGDAALYSPRTFVNQIKGRRFRLTEFPGTPRSNGIPQGINFSISILFRLHFGYLQVEAASSAVLLAVNAASPSRRKRSQLESSPSRLPFPCACWWMSASTPGVRESSRVWTLLRFVDQLYQRGNSVHLEQLPC